MSYIMISVMQNLDELKKKKSVSIALAWGACFLSQPFIIPLLVNNKTVIHSTAFGHGVIPVNAVTKAVVCTILSMNLYMYKMSYC